MEKELSEYFRKITQASYTLAEEKLNKYGLVKGQAHLLIAIRDNDGCTQKDLAEIFEVKYSSMSERLNKLEEMGYIERTIDESNSKFKRIYITSSGKAATIQCRKIQKDFNEILYRGFSKRDIKQLENYLDRITKNLDNI